MRSSSPTSNGVAPPWLAAALTLLGSGSSSSALRVRHGWRNVAAAGTNDRRQIMPLLYDLCQRP
jgi:hypothetical protein